MDESLFIKLSTITNRNRPSILVTKSNGHKLIDAHSFDKENSILYYSKINEITLNSKKCNDVTVLNKITEESISIDEIFDFITPNEFSEYIDWREKIIKINSQFPL